MKKNITKNQTTLILLAFSCAFSCFITKAQTPGQDKSVLLSAIVQNNPAQITLNWAPVSGATGFSIFKKNKTASSWGTAVATGLSGTSTSWTDNNVQVGQAYEYRVLKTGGTIANGYIYAGIEVPETFYRGKILLVYDTISTNGLSNEINRWINDVEGDGWEVIEIPVNQNDAVTNVKSRIINEYNNNPSKIKSIFIFGRVPIPYSGNIAPDGHTPDHWGAWPADGFYADMNGNWTDATVNNTGATQPRNHNIPGDGKFDQNTFPSDLELQIGRVDMRNLPGFSLTETQLLKKYLDKNHAYRNKLFTTIKRGLIDDNFTGYSEGFSASAWRSFSALFGASNIATSDYFTTMNSNNYQWSYGCGAGSYTSCAGVGNSTNFVTDSLRTVFTMLFGSYFGDWDSPSNNFLRMALANGSTLTNCWSGRPYWHFHHMTLGDNIGYSAIISMNNSSTYDANNNLRGVHMALMGDPTLRADIIAPAQNLVATYVNGNAELTWTASSDAVLGYNIYRKNDTLQQYEKINNQLITTLNYTDTCLIYQGIYKYMVRAVKLENTNAGSYYNMSTGITDTLYNPNYNPIVASFNVSQNGNQIIITNTSQNSTTYEWDFGDGNNSTTTHPTHTYSANGNYTITLVASSNCGSDTSTFNISVSVGINEFDNNYFTIYPNPAGTNLTIELTEYNLHNTQFMIYDLTGKQVFNTPLITPHTGNTKQIINLNKLPNGLYFVKLNNSSHTVKLIIQND